MRSKRKLILCGYDTAQDGLWTMTACKLTKAPQVQSFIDVPGRYAPLDASTALTDGQPYYGSAQLFASFESSEGDLAARQARIDAMVNFLDGRSVEIIHPDHPGYYLIGRVQVTQEYNDLAHCSVTVNAVCDPWLYAAYQTEISLAAAAESKTAQLINAGRMAIVPTVTVDGDVHLTYGNTSWDLASGEYALPELLLTPGTLYNQPAVHEVSYYGAGTITFTYREAVVAG